MGNQSCTKNQHGESSLIGAAVNGSSYQNRRGARYLNRSKHTCNIAVL